MRKWSETILVLLALWLSFTGSLFAQIQSVREKFLARYAKNLGIAKTECSNDAHINVQLNGGLTVTGACLFLHVDFITMRVAGKVYSQSPRKQV